jgi:hypothetical protein
MSKDLVDSILELRDDVERQLKANKYYIALNKLDELLAAIRPVEAEIAAAPVDDRQADAEASADSAAETKADDADERVWSGVVQERVVDELRPS